MLDKRAFVIGMRMWWSISTQWTQCISLSLHPPRPTTNKRIILEQCWLRLKHILRNFIPSKHTNNTINPEHSQNFQGRSLRAAVLWLDLADWEVGTSKRRTALLGGLSSIESTAWRAFPRHFHDYFSFFRPKAGIGAPELALKCSQPYLTSPCSKPLRIRFVLLRVLLL